MNNKVFLYIVLLIMIFLDSCYYDTEEALYQDVTIVCDSSDIFYKSHLERIFSYHCSNCHSYDRAELYGGNIIIEDSTSTWEYVLDGSLLGSLYSEDGFVQMPVDYLLDECSVLQIVSWIDSAYEKE